jgi:hypothetical protein
MILAVLNACKRGRCSVAQAAPCSNAVASQQEGNGLWRLQPEWLSPASARQAGEPMPDRNQDSAQGNV